MKFLYISILVFGFSIRVYTQSNDNFMNVEVLTPTSTKENTITKDYTKNDTLFTGIDTVSCFCEDTLFNGKCYAVLYYKNGLLIKQNGFYELPVHPTEGKLKKAGFLRFQMPIQRSVCREMR